MTRARGRSRLEERRQRLRLRLLETRPRPPYPERPLWRQHRGQRAPGEPSPYDAAMAAQVAWIETQEHQRRAAAAYLAAVRRIVRTCEDVNGVIV